MAIIEIGFDGGHHRRIGLALGNQTLKITLDLRRLQWPVIGPILGQRLENVGDIDDARFERQRIGIDMKRVALAIGGFMVVRGPARDFLDGVEALEHLESL